MWSPLICRVSGSRTCLTGRATVPPTSSRDITDTILEFTEGLAGLKNFAIYIFDYGAPVGLRMALKVPERISAIVSQNGNAYEEGLSNGWDTRPRV